MIFSFQGPCQSGAVTGRISPRRLGGPPNGRKRLARLDFWRLSSASMGHGGPKSAAAGDRAILRVRPAAI